jgi:hypothetical protein
VWAGLAVLALALIVICDIALAFGYVGRLSLADRLATDPLSVSTEELDVNDSYVSGALRSYVGLFSFAGVAFIGWMFVSARRVRDVRPDGLRHGAGWAIGSWFVPFLNLVRPPQIVNDLWAAPRPRNVRTTTPMVGWWWAFWIATIAFDRVATVQVTDPASLHLDATLQIVSRGLDVVAALLAARIVVVVARRLAHPESPSTTPLPPPFATPFTSEGDNTPAV